MAERTIEYLKSKFETGDKPSQQDFIDLIDTLNKSQTKLFIEKPIASSINTESLYRLCRLDDDGKIVVWQPLPNEPGSGGVWEINFNDLTEKSIPYKSSVILNQYLNTPEDGDTFTLSYTATSGGPIVDAIFTFKDSATDDMEVTIDADPLGMLINLNDKINTYITANSLSSRIISAVTYDGYLLINCNDFSSEPNGLWAINYKPTSDPIYDTNEFSGGSSGQNSIININDNMLLSSSWNDTATTVEEEAEAFKNYLNANFSDILEATVDGGTVTISATDFSQLEYNISLGDLYPSSCLSLNEIEPYVSSSKAQRGYNVLGVIDSIDLANGKAIIQVGGKAKVYLSENSTFPMIENIIAAMNGLILYEEFPGCLSKTIATNDGKVVFIGEILGEMDPELYQSFIFLSKNYSVGYPISNLLENNMLEVILNIGA